MWRNALAPLGAAALVVAHVALVVHGATRHSAVFDEVVYPTSGYAYLTTGDYRMNPEHPPLLKLLTGAAWLGTGLDARTTAGWDAGDQWLYGRTMIHGAGHQRALLIRARLPIALLSAALAAALFAIARRLGGDVNCSLSRRTGFWRGTGNSAAASWPCDVQIDPRVPGEGGSRAVGDLRRGLESVAPTRGFLFR